MKHRIGLILFILLLGSGVWSSRAQGTNGFVLERADAAEYVGLAGNGGLSAVIANVAPRFAVEYANLMHYVPLAPIPGELSELIGGVPPRFALEYANGNRYYPLAFPAPLINDQTPPQITSTSSHSAGTGVVALVISTNEFTRMQLQLGVQPGSYSQSYESNLYRKQHEFRLSSLAAGSTYYYSVSVTDQSGNLYQAPEGEFRANSSVFMPLLRNR